jgi:hypothetical protein
VVRLRFTQALPLRRRATQERDSGAGAGEKLDFRPLQSAQRRSEAGIGEALAEQSNWGFGAWDQRTAPLQTLICRNLPEISCLSTSKVERILLFGATQRARYIPGRGSQFLSAPAQVAIVEPAHQARMNARERAGHLAFSLGRAYIRSKELDMWLRMTCTLVVAMMLAITVAQAAPSGGIP